jgi:plastocyanin
MKRLRANIRFSTRGFCYAFVLTVLIAARPVQADVWHADVGAQSTDQANQALAFLTSELWIHAGDSIAFTFATGEIHTVSFLKPAQVRPPFAVGCPGTTPDGSIVTGAACVNSGTLAGGQTYTVTFPTPGNFKLVCLVHVRMTGTVHVLNLSATLPHDQAFYDRQAQTGRTELLSDASSLAGRGIARAVRTPGFEVTAGNAEIASPAGGGSSSASVMRFLGGSTTVHVGDTVEWTNISPVVSHTVTFGTEPANLMPPSAGVTTDPDGALHAVISSPTDNVNSGFLGQPNQEVVGIAQYPLGATRFRVTFTAPGTFNYFCGLHDDLGMVGSITVLP